MNGSKPFRAVHRFTETPNCSNYLFLRNSGRKTVAHFSWNCSSERPAVQTQEMEAGGPASRSTFSPD
ncbi:MAG: hypothetical protein EOQ30_21370 [Mesorhizobium sp.]|nr:MAG: hypothetical protein EOQ29_18565 [Mesorhizobium sp.]RWA80809.1 MAG: hypothetical protein EOQ30_21370 [Mesorhizobium sp.]